MKKEEVLKLLELCNIEINTNLATEDNLERIELPLIDSSFAKKEDLFFFSGASKSVIIPNNEKYVIKIPYDGYQLEETLSNSFTYCSKKEETYEYNFLNFYEFEGANSYDYWDYCLQETIIYHYAKKKKVEKVFAKTRRIGEVKGRPIYIQERAIPSKEYSGGILPDERAYKEISKKTNEICKDSSYSFREINPIWKANAYFYYGEKKFKDIMNFITEYMIEDLHDGNLGYIKDRPVIIDYSDYKS